MAVLSFVVVTASAAAQPPSDAGTGERSVALTWVLLGVPSDVYGSEWTGCSLVSHEGSVSVRCPTSADRACVEIARRDLTPDPGDEIVLGCGAICEDQFPSFGQDAGVALGPYLVVAVVSASGPVAGIATTPDMSCGSQVSFLRAGSRWRMQLVGGGEDGGYRVTYGMRGQRFVRVTARAL